MIIYLTFILIYRNWIDIITLFHVYKLGDKLVKHSIVKLKSDGDEEENLKECYINANFINVIDKIGNIVNKWKGENDCSNLGSFESNIWSFLEDECSRKYEYDCNVVQFKREPMC